MAKDKRNKRRTGKLVMLNEEDLIRQVKLRPILYDKSLKGYRKSTLRYQYWKEVGEAIGTTVEKCRRRWRSLRDAFSKHYKYLNRTDFVAQTNKRKKWVFYDQMGFMAPYLDNAYCEIEDTLLDDFPDNSDDGHTMTLYEANEDCRLATVPERENMHQEEIEEKLGVPVQSRASTVIGDESQFIASILANTVSSSPRIPPPSASIGETSRKIPPEDISTVSSLAMCLDSDEKFLMSCAPILRRLTHRKNAMARLKIQQILYSIEFESEER